MLDETDQPRLADHIEEASDIGVQYEAHLGAADADHQCVERVMRPPLRPESVREPEEIRLVNLVQHRNHSPLDDLVLQSRDRKRTLPTVRLGNIYLSLIHI